MARAIPLTSQKLLLYNISNVFYSCPKKQFNVDGCTSSCMIPIICNCAIRAGYFYFPPKLSNCKKNDSLVQSHLINLAVMQHLFSDEALRNIESDTTFDSPPSPVIPDIKIYDNKLNSVVASDQQDQIQLNKLADAVKQGAIVYKSEVDPLLNGDIPILKDTWSLTHIFVTAVPFILSIADTVAIGYIIYNFRSLQAALTGLAVIAPKVNALDISWQNELFTTSMAPKSSAPPRQVGLQINLMSFTELAHLACVVSVVLIVMLWLFKNNSNQNTKICLEVANGNTYFNFGILELPACPKIYHMTAIDYIILENLVITPCKCSLTINWNA